MGFDSIHMLSGRPSEDKIPYLTDRISKMEPGKHLIVSHCAVDSPELRSMTSEESENAEWALQYRVSDLAALTSDEVREGRRGNGVSVWSASAACASRLRLQVRRMDLVQTYALRESLERRPPGVREVETLTRDELPNGVGNEDRIQAARGCTHAWPAGMWCSSVRPALRSHRH